MRLISEYSNYVMFKKKQDLSLIILALIMFINALSVGIVLPLLYPYSIKFGITPFTLSLLFATYSFFQLLATPIIGRLSDRFGRKPLLLLSILGSSLSLALFAMAQTVLMLFIARALDGITGGNIPVAQAMITDKTKKHNRAKNFGILGSMFGLGFLVGPAIGGFTSTISLATPFWLASALALLATILGTFILKETLPKKRAKKQKKENLFSFKTTFSALTNPNIGPILVLTFIAYFAHQSVSIGFQTYSVDTLKIGARMIGILFTSVGITLVITRSIGLKTILKIVKNNKLIITSSFIISAIALTLIFFSHTLTTFWLLIIMDVVAYSLINPIITSLLSQRINDEDQGIALGINQSYASLGQTLGPISAGLIAQIDNKLIFLWSSFLFIIGAIISMFIKHKTKMVNI